MITDDEYLKLLQNYDFNYKNGDIVKGVIEGYDKNNLIVDIKAKSSAICPEKEILKEENENVKDLYKLKEEYDFFIMYKDNDEDIYYLSAKKVAISINSKILKEKYKNNETIKGKVTAITKGGILVDVANIKGFVPLSQIKENKVEVGDSIDLKVLSFDNSLTNFIFSNKKVYQDNIEEIKKEIFDKIELNMVIKGTITRLVDFGAFVDIGGIEALLPLSQISYKWIDKPEDVLKEGDKKEFEIIGIDKEKQRISLSLKSLKENPWLKAQEFIEDKKIIEGKVTNIKPFGAFVEIYPDVEGLINNRQIEEYQLKTNKTLEINSTLQVEIKRFDAKEQKIILKIV